MPKNYLLGNLTSGVLNKFVDGVPALGPPLLVLDKQKARTFGLATFFPAVVGF